MSAHCGIISHRGLCRRWPSGFRKGENTLEAFDAGVAALERIGLSAAIEFDVRLSKDGIPVVIHDDTVDRTTNGRGAVRSLTLAELQKLDAGYGRRIPSLDDVLAHFAMQDVTLHLELKESGIADAVAASVDAHHVAARSIISAFDAEDAPAHDGALMPSPQWAELSACTEKVRFAFAVTEEGVSRHGGEAALVRMASEAGAYAIHPERSAATAGFVALAHDAGLQVNAWTVNDRATYEALAARGVDNVFSDNPAFLLASVSSADGGTIET